jgi:hypothetical protein
VIQSYRHRYNQAPGDPVLQPIEDRLAAQPSCMAPATRFRCRRAQKHTRFFTGPYQRRVIPVAGHFLPQEASAAVVEALSELPKP